MPNQFVVRYGLMSEVARCEQAGDLELVRGDQVVIQTDRGLQLGEVLERVKPPVEPGIVLPEAAFTIDRLATAEDLLQETKNRQHSEAEFGLWAERINTWNLDLQLVDIERPLAGDKQIVYVLCDRGPESTKLALQAAAAGLGTIEVQPVSQMGVAPAPEKPKKKSGGCGSEGGCGCG